MFNLKKQLVIVLLVALAPVITLLIRGVVWGADSFAYWAVSCGNSSVTQFIHSPSWFVWFIQNIINCNLWILAGVMFVLYFFALLGIWQIGKRFFSGHQSWRLPVYVGCLTPLFFIESLRFEQQFFGWTLALIGIGLFLVYWERKESFRYLSLSWAIPCFIGSLILWLPSIFLWGIVPFLVFSSPRVQKTWLIALLLVMVATQAGYVLGSFNFTSIVAEELPLIGLVFVIHILHFYKNIPGTLKWYTILLVIIGALKSKYMFLATPLLLVGLLDKQLKTGIVLKREVFGIKEIPVLYVCGILLVGWCLMGISLYPTQKDLNEMSNAIQLSKDTNQLLYNDWGDGWMLVSLGYDTNYKASVPQPDWNNLSKPFVAWTKEDLNYLCVKLSKRTYQC